MTSWHRKEEKIIKKFVFLGIHKVNGDFLAIHYLRDASPRYVESLFFFAKKYGDSIFEWDGDLYEIKKNTDLSFTIIKKTTEEDRNLQTFKKRK